MTWGPPIPFMRPYLYRPGDRISELMLASSRDQAEATRHQGDIWGNAIANLGQTIAGGIQEQGRVNQQKQLGAAVAAGTAPDTPVEGPPDASGAPATRKVDRAAILKTLPPELVPQAQQAFQAFDDHAAAADLRKQQAAEAAAQARQHQQAATQADHDAIGTFATQAEPLLKGPDGGLGALTVLHGLAKERGFPGADQFDGMLASATAAWQHAQQTGDQAAMQTLAEQVRGMGGGLIGQMKMAMSPAAQEALAKLQPKGVVVPEGGTLMNPETGATMGKGAEKVSRVTPGSFEDFAQRQFGPSPTPQQLLHARTQWAAAGKEPEAADNAPTLTHGAMEQAAVRYLTDGTLPPMGMGKAGARVREAILNRAAELDPSANIALTRAGFTSDTASLKKLQQQTDAVSAFENTATKNAAILEEALKKLPDTGTQFLNRPWRALQGRLGSDDMAKFDTIRQSVQNEYARIISNPTLSGTMSDSARREAEALLSPAATVGQMRTALETLKREAANRRESYQSQLDEIHTRMKGGGGATPEQPKPAAAPAGPKQIKTDAEYAALPSGAEFIAPDGSHRRKP